MRLDQRLVLVIACLLAPFFAAAQGDPRAGTYRAQAGGATLLVRATDARIDLHHLGTNQSVSVATFATAAGLNGVLPTGEVVSLGKVLGTPMLLVGTTLLPLTPIGADEYAQAEARAARTEASAAATPSAGGGGTSLGGVALLYAKSGNGYGQVRRYDFCSDGSFFYRFEELQSSQFGNGAGERRDSGTWQLSGSTLTVQFRGQGTRSHAFVVRSSTSVSLDGTVFAAERSARCR